MQFKFAVITKVQQLRLLTKFELIRTLECWILAKGVIYYSPIFVVLKLNCPRTMPTMYVIVCLEVFSSVEC